MKYLVKVNSNKYIVDWNDIGVGFYIPDKIIFFNSKDELRSLLNGNLSEVAVLEKNVYPKEELKHYFDYKYMINQDGEITDCIEYTLIEYEELSYIEIDGKRIIIPDELEEIA